MSNVITNWAQFARPGMTPVAGPSGNFNFYRPDNSQLPTGVSLGNYLTNNGQAGPNEITNRTVKYDGGLTREALGNSTDFLNTQLGKGFMGVEEMFNRYGSLGGLGGMTGSAVYRPGGTAVAQGTQQGTTGQPLPWNANNPFKATF